MSTTTFETGHALLIGVGDDLPITVNDATAINNMLADPSKGGYNQDRINLLINEAADRAGILAALDKLIANVDESSTVFIFYSGHGGYFKQEDRYYLCPNGFDNKNHTETWLPSDEFRSKLEQLSAKTIFLFLDCCHAQGVATKQGGEIGESPESPARVNLTNADKLAEKFNNVSGLSYVSSCRAEQQSFILKGDNNSLFTKVLVEVFEGKHRKSFDDQYIRLTETLQYLFKEVPLRVPSPHRQNPTVKIEMEDDLILSLAPVMMRKSTSEVKVETNDFLIEMEKEELDQLQRLFKTQSDMVHSLRESKSRENNPTSIFKIELQILDAQLERQELKQKIMKSMKTLGLV